MRLASVFTGSAFRAALWGLAAFVVVLAAISTFVLLTTRRAVLDDMASGLEAQLALVADLYANEPQDEADALLRVFASDVAAPRMVVAVFDGTRIVAANAAVAPSPERWHVVESLTTARGTELGPTLILTGTAGPYRVVLGRSMDRLEVVSRSLARALLVAGIVVVVAFVGIGWTLSVRSGRTLDGLEAALDAVSRGDTATRVPVGDTRTQIGRVAAQINAHLVRLERMVHDSRDGATRIAHDLRTPLARAMLAAERLAARHDEAVPLEAELARLASIVDAILRIARIERDESAPLAPVNLRAVADEVADLYAPVAEDAGQSLSVEGECTVPGDAGMLSQMVANLVANATAHAGRGAAIAITLVSDPPRLVCADTGPGIAEALRERALEPFERGDASEGTGLGLTLVRAVAERHGAGLELEDNGPGLRITVSFPSLSFS